MDIIEGKKYADEESLYLFFNVIVKKVGECLDKGLSREMIMKYFLDCGLKSRTEGQVSDYFAENKDLINSIIDIEIRYKTKEFREDKIRNLCETVFKSNLTNYTAKDGKQYDNMYDLSKANDNYYLREEQEETTRRVA